MSDLYIAVTDRLNHNDAIVMKVALVYNQDIQAFLINTQAIEQDHSWILSGSEAFFYVMCRIIR